MGNCQEEYPENRLTLEFQSEQIPSTFLPQAKQISKTTDGESQKEQDRSFFNHLDNLNRQSQRQSFYFNRKSPRPQLLSKLSEILIQPDQKQVKLMNPRMLSPRIKKTPSISKKRSEKYLRPLELLEEQQSRQKSLKI